MTIDFGTAENLANAPHLYEAEMVRAAIEVFESDLRLCTEQARRLGIHGAHKSTLAQIKRLNGMIRACKKALR